MKMENKRAAQAARAAERQRQKNLKVIKGVLALVVVVVAFAFIIVFANRSANSSEEASTEQATQSTSDSSTSSTDSSEETAQVTLNSDTSLVVEEGDIVRVSYVGSIDGFEFEGGTGSYDLTIGSRSFIGDFEEQLIGHNVGEVVDVNVSFPDDYGRTYIDADGEEQSFNGAPALFVVTIEGIYK